VAKFGTPEDVGQFTLGFALSAPIIIFTMLGLRQYQATDVRDEYSFYDYLGVRLFTTLVALLALLAITLPGVYSKETMIVILVIGFAKGIEAISDICQGLFQKYERMDRVAVSLLIKAFLTTLVMPLCFYFTRSIIWGTSGLAFSWLLVLLGYDLPNARIVFRANRSDTPTTKLFVGKENVKKNIRIILHTVPLGMAASLVTLNSNIPRYMIQGYLGERELGIFAAIVYLLYAGNVVVNALGQSASPRLALYYTNNEPQKYFSLLIKLVFIGAVIGIIGIAVSFFFGKQILTLIYQAEYGNYANVMSWIMVGGLISFMSSFLGYGMTASRSLKVQPFIYASLCLLTYGFGMVLIPRYGILGAAWLMPIVGMLQMALTLAVNKNAIQKSGQKKLSWLG
jgi:O-antigen/teichoic acid export membrane protein